MLAFIWVLIEPQKMKSQVMDNFVNFGPILGHLSLFGAEICQKLTKLKKKKIGLFTHVPNTFRKTLVQLVLKIVPRKVPTPTPS